MNFVEKAKTLQNYFRLGNFKRVLEGCEILNKKFPNNSFILNLMGMAYQELEKHQKATTSFELALKADSSNIAAMNNLANTLKGIGQYVKAEKIYKKILEINPSYINAYNNYGNLKSEVNDIEGAIRLYNQALVIVKEKKINPIVILNHLATSFHSLNKKKEAIEIINEILKIDKYNAGAHKSLSQIYKYSKKDEETMSHISTMEKILKENNFEKDKEGLIFFALGKAYDDLKDTKMAIKFLSSGNKIIKKNRKINIVKDINIMNNIIKIFENIDLNVSHKSFLDKKIIFICGMPRSGTTLTEQILSSHTKVYGAGELSFLTNNIFDNFFYEDNLNKQKIVEYQNSLKNLINDQYFENLNLFNINEHVLTDKAPLNFKWIGFIKIFFPNSKIVYCKRNPKDNCLSLYKNNFGSSVMNWSFDQSDISNFYNHHTSLMNFWHSKIPESIHTVEYEKIVLDKKNETEKLLKFCELEWDDNCLNHHKNIKTPIKTASISQAREKVYNSSINSSDNYKDYLKEMFDNLI